MTNTTTNLPDLAPMPAYVLTPVEWAREAMKRANDYTGMVEGTWFLVEARRYLALAKRIEELELALKT